jgi:hypothetical protein
MAPTGQRDAHTPQSMQASDEITGAAPFSLVIALAGQTEGLRSAGKSASECDTTSVSAYVMHGAVSQRKHEDFDVDPSEKATTAV